MLKSFFGGQAGIVFNSRVVASFLKNRIVFNLRVVASFLKNQRNKKVHSVFYYFGPKVLSISLP